MMESIKALPNISETRENKKFGKFTQTQGLRKHISRKLCVNFGTKKR